MLCECDISNNNKKNPRFPESIRLCVHTMLLHLLFFSLYLTFIHFVFIISYLILITNRVDSSHLLNLLIKFTVHCCLLLLRYSRVQYPILLWTFMISYQFLYYVCMCMIRTRSYVLV